MAEEDLDLQKDPATVLCEIAAMKYLAILVRDTDLHKEIDFDKLKTSWKEGQTTADSIFDLVAKKATDRDIKKDILMYKQWGKCDYSDYTEPPE